MNNKLLIKINKYLLMLFVGLTTFPLTYSWILLLVLKSPDGYDYFSKLFNIMITFDLILYFGIIYLILYILLYYTFYQWIKKTN